MQVVPQEKKKAPPTTCYFDRLCQSARHAVFIPGSYRLSLEPRESLKASTAGYQALSPFTNALSDPETIGRGAEGQIWMCLVDLELLYEGHLERLAGAHNRPLTALHTFTCIIESLYPETRSIPSLPAVLTLSSLQRHTVYLWVGVHRWILYLGDPVNAGVKKLLEEGVYAEKAFPKDLFPAFTGQALYRDAETRDFRGQALNDRFVELTWSQVRHTKLSEAMRMSDELVRTTEEEVNETTDSNDEKDGKLLLAVPAYLSTLTRTLQDSEAEFGAVPEKKQRRSVKLNRLVQADPSNKERARRLPPHAFVQPQASTSQPTPGVGFKLKFKPKPPLPRAHKTFPEDTTALKDAASPETHEKEVEKGSTLTLFGQIPSSTKPEAVGKGEKRDRDVGEPATDLESDNEERRRKRAKVAWNGYLKSLHCS